MKNKIKKNSRYKDWFDFYCSVLVEPGCIALESIVDEYCQKVCGNERSRMLELFGISAQFELDFWNSAYNVSKFNQVPKEH